MKLKKTSAILKDTANILYNNNWIQNGLCQDAKGRNVYPDSNKAVSFDIMAALWRASGTLKFPKDAGRLIGGIIKADGYWTSYHIVAFNDNKKTTLAKVLSVLDAAYILALQIEGKRFRG